jgi:hypothetical protein
MKDGEPKYSASERLREIRNVITMVKKQCIPSLSEN